MLMVIKKRQMVECSDVTVAVIMMVCGRVKECLKNRAIKYFILSW